jgi:sulfatase modifying factor 1
MEVGEHLCNCVPWPSRPSLAVMRAILACLAAGVLAGVSNAAEPLLKLELGGGVGMDLLLVSAGSFTQGSPPDEAGRGADENARPVRISEDYYIGRTAVTRGQWERFIAETRYRSEAESGTSGGYGWNGKALEQRKEFTWRNPGFAQTPEHPVCLVTFPDAQAFCSWLEKKVNRKVTLPTEAQWEYACRAGTTSAWFDGGSGNGAWHKDNAGKGTQAVDSKPANPWELFMGGNVSEWCLDWYAPYPAGEAVDPRQDNPNLSDKPRRVLRGGSWIRGAGNTRSAARYRADPRSRNADIGFRIVCALEANPPPAAVNLPSVESNAPAPRVVEEAPRSERGESPVVGSQRSAGGSLIGGLFKGLICFLVPVLIVLTLIRKATRRKPAALPQSDAFLRRPGGPVAAPVRKTDDGFWIQGDWPEGTLLTVSYIMAGAEVVKEILYRPGDGGQFIFTGADPGPVSVVAGEHPADSLAPPVFTGPSETFERRRRDDDDSPRPPIFPSAY